MENSLKQRHGATYCQLRQPMSINRKFDCRDGQGPMSHWCHGFSLGWFNMEIKTPAILSCFFLFICEAGHPDSEQKADLI